MRILHYIAHVRGEDLLSQYLTTLTTIQERMGAEVCVVTKRDDMGAKFDQFLPHIVHIHTLWSWPSAQVAQLARKRNCGVVISTHGQLDAFRCCHERKWRKRMALLTFQRRMICQADALLATDEREAKCLEKLGWNNHIDTITNALLDASVSQEEMAALSLKLYQKVVDTRYAHYLSAEDHEIMGSLLHAAIDDMPSATLSAEKVGRLHTLDGEQWRRICLWADDEDVMPLIAKAIHLLSIDAPLQENAPSGINRFPQKHPKKRGGLTDNELLYASDGSKEKWQEVLHDETESLQKVVTLILNARTLDQHRELSLHHMCDLYTAIKFLDYDEDQLKSLLSRFSATGIGRALMGWLAQKLLLTEGFMPLKPKRKPKIKSLISNNHNVKQSLNQSIYGS